MSVFRQCLFGYFSSKDGSLELPEVRRFEGSSTYAFLRSYGCFLEAEVVSYLVAPLRAYACRGPYPNSGYETKAGRSSGRVVVINRVCVCEKLWLF